MLFLHFVLDLVGLQVLLIVLLEIKCPYDSPNAHNDKPPAAHSPGADGGKNGADGAIDQKQYRANPTFGNLHAKGKAHDQRHIDDDQIVFDVYAQR